MENVNRRQHEPIFWDACPTEMDNHADTHCFGRNFRPIYWTGQECTVAPFLAEYSEQCNIRICTGATAYTLPSGEVIILQFGQGLWFGDRMEKSLINPNQCRAFGTPICDDPTDPHRSLGINVDGSLIIHMDMDGSTCGFTSRYPTDDEVRNCRTFTLSDTLQWDPTQDIFNVSALVAEDGKDYKCRHIHLVTNDIPCQAPSPHIQDNIHIPEFDRAMAAVSLGTMDSEITTNLLQHVKVSATFTNK